MKWPVYVLVTVSFSIALSSAVVSEKDYGGKVGAANSRLEDVAKPIGGESRSLEEERSKKGGILRRMALPFLLLLGLKAGITIPVIFGIVSLVAFKGMWSGFTALIVTAALSLRGLIPPSKIIQLPPPASPHHVHVADYIADYRRDDHLARMDESTYHPYNVPNLPQSHLPPNY